MEGILMDKGSGKNLALMANGRAKPTHTSLPAASISIESLKGP
jgi:hypothetical protein